MSGVSSVNKIAWWVSVNNWVMGEYGYPQPLSNWQILGESATLTALWRRWLTGCEGEIATHWYSSGLSSPVSAGKPRKR